MKIASKIKLLEEDNPDKNKRWNMVFPGSVIGGKTIETLDENVREFMARG